MSLESIPFYGAYAARRQMNEQEPVRQLQQAQAVLGLQGALREQQQAEQLRAALAQSGGDVEKAMQAAIASGNLAGAAKLAPIIEARRKQAVGQPIGRGGLLMPDGSVIPPVESPQKQEFAPPELIRLQEFRKRYLDSGLPETHPFIKQIDERITKINTENQGVTVNMPATSDLLRGEDGFFYRVVIGKDGQVRHTRMADQQGRPLAPAETAGERRDGANAAATAATIESVRQRINSLTQKLQSSDYLVGPAGVARRAVEAGAGVVAPGIETPALDYNNELRLLVADVRKMVEKDPNLSNEERRNLYETLGGGVFQTPGSAVRALNNVMGYVENKRVTGSGPRRDAPADVPPPERREVNKVYPTPRGPMKWTGTGWVPPQ